MNADKRRWVYCLLLMFLFLVGGCQKQVKPQGITVPVQRVLSGQSLEVSGSLEVSNRIRLIGVDAPDFRQEPWGEQAKQRLQELINNQQVLLESDVESKYCFENRCTLLAYVWVNNKLLNEELAKEGLVLASPRDPNTKYQKRLESAQEYARIMGLGIWNPENPMRQTPAEFRKQRENNTGTM
ncbi:thermonuclease family protein [Ancylothrix sp. C2]|uniref:thermonuclease family protein n=1 Tax=Ancylothrix sp. D3o TaxID=2953691 RepID=UPI0021BAB8A9|nr:thermonuclease family protein [Ancylothrix sp. D3o]MCT7951634.1 thermonuclease family protein [Ancylothrix sp. D3o]